MSSNVAIHHKQLSAGMAANTVGPVARALQRRRSVRAFSEAQLDDTLVNEILQAALAAPPWGNVQP